MSPPRWARRCPWSPWCGRCRAGGSSWRRRSHIPAWTPSTAMFHLGEGPSKSLRPVLVWTAQAGCRWEWGRRSPRPRPPHAGQPEDPDTIGTRQQCGRGAARRAGRSLPAGARRWPSRCRRRGRGRSRCRRCARGTRRCRPPPGQSHRRSARRPMTPWDAHHLGVRRDHRVDPVESRGGGRRRAQPLDRHLGDPDEAAPDEGVDGDHGGQGQRQPGRARPALPRSGEGGVATHPCPSCCRVSEARTRTVSGAVNRRTRNPSVGHRAEGLALAGTALRTGQGPAGWRGG